jgi:hypothetical protein
MTPEMIAATQSAGSGAGGAYIAALMAGWPILLAVVVITSLVIVGGMKLLVAIARWFSLLILLAALTA